MLRRAFLMCELRHYLDPMAVRDEITNLFDEAQQRIDAAMTPRGVAPTADAPIPFAVMLPENQRAVRDSLLLLADRIDAIERGSAS